MATWLEEIVSQHKELESPLSFWYWSALTAISAVLKDSVWLDRGGLYKLYPNIYVLLHAESGLKKGPPISMAKQLVKVPDNTRIISGRSSIQGILKEIGTAQTKPGGVIIKKSVAFICSSELSSSIVEDKVATTILTDLYDRQYNVGEWRSLLKMESFNLIDPTITMLTATNEAHSSDFFTRKDVSGGYFARTFIIYETKRNKSNSLVAPMLSRPDYPKSGEYLKELSKLSGPFKPLASETKDGEYRHEKEKEGRPAYFTDAGILYDNWYDSFLEEVDAQDIKDETGTLNRFPDSVLKVAMLISLGSEPNLEISEKAMIEAIFNCEKLVGNIRKTTLGKSKIDDHNTTRKTIAIQELMKRDTHEISRLQLNKKFWMQGNSAEWDEVMLSLEVSGMITIQQQGNQIIYKMPDKQYEEMKKYLQGKNK